MYEVRKNGWIWCSLAFVYQHLLRFGGSPVLSPKKHRDRIPFSFSPSLPSPTGKLLWNLQLDVDWITITINNVCHYLLILVSQSWLRNANNGKIYVTYHEIHRFDANKNQMVSPDNFPAIPPIDTEIRHGIISERPWSSRRKAYLGPFWIPPVGVKSREYLGMSWDVW